MRETNWDAVRDLVTAGRLHDAAIVEVRSNSEVPGSIIASGSGFNAGGFTIRWTHDGGGDRTTTFSGWNVESIQDEDGGWIGFKIIRKHPNPPSDLDLPCPTANEYRILFAKRHTRT